MEIYSPDAQVPGGKQCEAAAHTPTHTHTAGCYTDKERVNYSIDNLLMFFIQDLK